MVAPAADAQEGVWLVVGGAGKGGIVVRTGAEFWATELARLETGALVREIQREGERILYKKITGKGPDIGWISLAFKGKPLLAAAASGAPLPRPPEPDKLEDREAALEAVRKDWRKLESVAPGFRADRTFVLAAVSACGHALMHADGTLQADRDIVLAAVAQNGNAIKHAKPSLRTDPEVVLVAAKQSSTALRHVPARLLADRELVVSLLRKDSQALQFVDRALRDDPEVVAVAVEQDVRCLEYATPAVKADRNIALAAVQKEAKAFEYLAASVRKDREVVLAAVEHDALALRFASSELRADHEIVTTAIQKDPRALEFASPRTRAYRAIVLEALEKDPLAIQYAADEVRADYDVMLAAVRLDRQALQYASPELRSDPKLNTEPCRAPGTNKGEALLLEDADEEEDLKELVEQVRALRKRTFLHKTREEDEFPESSHVTLLADSTKSRTLAYVLYTCDPRGGQCLFVFELVVHEDHRNKGLGSELLKWAIRRAKLGQVFAVWLNSLTGRPEHLYKSFGFQRRVLEKPRDGTVPMELMLRDPKIEAQLRPLAALASNSDAQMPPGWSPGASAYSSYQLRARVQEPEEAEEPAEPEEDYDEWAARCMAQVQDSLASDRAFLSQAAQTPAFVHSPLQLRPGVPDPNAATPEPG